MNKTLTWKQPLAKDFNQRGQNLKRPKLGSNSRACETARFVRVIFKSGFWDQHPKKMSSVLSLDLNNYTQLSCNFASIEGQWETSDIEETCAVSVGSVSWPDHHTFEKLFE